MAPHHIYGIPLGDVGMAEVASRPADTPVGFDINAAIGERYAREAPLLSPTPDAVPMASARDGVDLRALSEAATPGPWTVVNAERKRNAVIRAGDPVRVIPETSIVLGWPPFSVEEDANAAFIVACVNHVRAQLARPAFPATPQPQRVTDEIPGSSFTLTDAEKLRDWYLNKGDDPDTANIVDALIGGVRALASATPPSAEGGEVEPAAWSYTLATAFNHTGAITAWEHQPRITAHKPNCDPDMVRDLTPLYAHPSRSPVDAEAVRAALTNADGCFEAAYAEGLIEALATEGDEAFQRLRDLVQRRLYYAQGYVQEALARLPSTKGGQ